MKKMCLFLMLIVGIGSHAQTKTTPKSRTGIASYYHQKFQGRKTATGEIFNHNLLTAASNYFKLGSKVKITNILNGKSVIVTINDRMSKGNKRLVDLTRTAAKQLEFIEKGLCKVLVEIID